MNKFGKRLKELREKNGYSQQKLADELHLSRSTIEMYEQGKRDPSTETKEAIADLFNVNMDYLLDREYVDSEKMTKAIELYDMFEKLTPEDLQREIEEILYALWQRPDPQV